MFALRLFLCVLVCSFSSFEGVSESQAHPSYSPHRCTVCYAKHRGHKFHKRKASSAKRASSSSRRHDGFFLRFTGGTAKAESDVESGFNNDSVPMGIAEFAMGSSVSDNLSWHLGFVGSGVRDPETPVWMRPHGGRDHVVVGFGLTFHLMPSNFYFSFVSGRALHTVDRVQRAGNVLPEDRAPEHVWDGYGFAASIGKEWWLSSNWGLGIAFQTLVIESSEGRFTSSGPVLSVTFN